MADAHTCQEALLPLTYSVVVNLESPDDATQPRIRLAHRRLEASDLVLELAPQRPQHLGRRRQRSRLAEQADGEVLLARVGVPGDAAPHQQVLQRGPRRRPRVLQRVDQREAVLALVQVLGEAFGLGVLRGALSVFSLEERWKRMMVS